MRRGPRLITTALLALAFATGTSTVGAQQRTADGIVFNFQNAELVLVLRSLAQQAGINLIVADIPSKLVSLSTPQPLTPPQVEQLIRDFARDHSITVAQTGNVLRLQGTPAVQGAEARQLFIYRLKHARAPVLAQTLQQLFGGAVRPGTAAAAQNTLQQQLRNLEVQAQQQRPGQAQAPIVITQAGRAELEGAVQIVADEVTNSLLVRATPADWQVIQQAMLALDLRPLQVVIEVVIAEVRRTNELNVGTSVSAIDTRARAGESTDGRFGVPPRAGDPDFSLRIVRAGELNIEATLSALAASGNVRVLSRPVVHAQNNQEARISVGEQRPFVQVQRSLPTSEPVRDAVVQYIPVATALTILPTINADGYVNLVVSQEVNSTTNEIQFDAPVISTRSAQTQILARNGQTVVIGGLVDRQQDRSRAGVPFLKDIPLLGFLFGTTRDRDVNSELFLFLTPYIVASDDEADRVREEIERKAEQLQPLLPIVPLLPPVNPDTLPLRPDTLTVVRPGAGGR